MRSFLARRKWWLLGLPTVLAAAVFGGLEHSARSLWSPPRQPFAEHHLRILNDPAAHGMTLDRFVASDGTPFLLCRPTPLPGKRGQLLRSQLLDQGVSLAAPGEEIGNLAILHGRRGRKEDYLPIAERFCAVGFRCVLPDLPAHGEHPVDASTFGVREAAIPSLVLEEAARLGAFPAAPAALFGTSMGGSVAVHAAALDADQEKWSSLVVVASFDALREVVAFNAREIAGPAAPMIEGFVTWRFPQGTGVALADVAPVEKARNLRLPVLVAHGTDDRTVPHEAGRRLFAAFPGRTRWVDVPGADHQNVFITDFPLFATAADWLLASLPPPDDNQATPPLAPPPSSPMNRGG